MRLVACYLLTVLRSGALWNLLDGTSAMRLSLSFLSLCTALGVSQGWSGYSAGRFISERPFGFLCGVCVSRARKPPKQKKPIFFDKQICE